jgi:DNA processing protein
LTDTKVLDRLRLIRSPNIGPVTYRQLLTRFGSATAALQALPDLAARGGGKKFVVADAGFVAREYDAIKKFGAKYLFLGDTDYPDLLAQLDNAPPVLTYLGDLEILNRPNVSIVGARNASASACRFARQLAIDLGGEGIVVTSGLARGIDTSAHVGALGTGTVAVIAGGIDVIYPPENAELQAAIAKQGLLLAEQPIGTEPRARHFPYRNRIIAGLTLGTVVIEAAPRSGSLITARLANEAGRQVMAVPGSPLDPRARGCNNLIREGATLVQDAFEIAEIIKPIDNRMTRKSEQSPLFSNSHQAIDLENGRNRKIVTGLLGSTNVSVDEIVRQSGLPSQEVQMILLELELAGRLERGAGAKVSLVA